MPGNSSAVPLPVEQLLSIREAKSKPLEEGDVWFLISKTWFKSFEDYCLSRPSKSSSSAISLGPIDNSDITQVAPHPGKEYDLLLMPPIVEGDTAEFIPKEAHESLVRWYGSAKYPYEFVVTPLTPGDWRMNLEMYPRRLRVYHTESSEPRPPIYVTISRNDPLSSLVAQIGYEPSFELYRVDVDRSDRPWGGLRPMTTKEFCQLTGEKRLILGTDSTEDSLRKSVDESLLTLQDTLVIVDSAAVRQSQEELEATVGSTTAKPPFVKGSLGLFNLGETCYMNSALQCITHVVEVNKYFMSDQYKQELNPKNPLGTGGVLASTYGDLVKRLYTPSTVIAYAPRALNYQVSLHAPQFSGYAQCDAQELLSFLLDGLHEDLNRVVDKPYVPNPEWEGGGNKEILKLAKDSWDGYKKRNDSVIVDLFQGQYKNTLTCSECQNTSITFDPFMYFSLPVPATRTWEHEIYYVPWEVSNPRVLARVQLPYNSPAKALKELVGQMFESSPKDLFVAEVHRGLWYKTYWDDNIVAEINADDRIVVYELLIPLSEAAWPDYKHRPFILPMYHTIHDDTQKTVDQSSPGTFLGLPTFMGIDPSETATEESLLDPIREIAPVLDLGWAPVSISLRKGRSEVNPTPAGSLSVEFGGSQPVPWADRREGPDAESPLRLEPMDILCVGWAPQSRDAASGTSVDEVVWRGFMPYNPNGEKEPSTTPQGHKGGAEKTLSLEDCLAEFTKPEILEGDNLWYCPKCKTHRKATKSLQLWKTPEILVFHLKRFSNLGSLREKINVPVDYPVKGLDLSRWVGESLLSAELDGAAEQEAGAQGENTSSRSPIYDLFAVSEHEGDGLGSGHYRAYAHNEEDDQWYHYTDARVTKCDISDAMTKHAYMLFYRRRA